MKPRNTTRRKPIARRTRGGAAPEPVVARSALPDAIVAILDEHRYILRLLALLDDQVAAIGRGEAPDAAAIDGVMHYMVNFPDRYHHPKEDLIFERMRTRDRALRARIDGLRHGHREVIDAGRRLLAQTRALGDGSTARQRRALAAGLRVYATELRRHIETEEQHVFMPAVALLKPADWRAIDRRIRPVIDPLFGAQVHEHYRPLLARYLERVSRVATGEVPFMLFEGVASGLERVLHMGLRLGNATTTLLADAEARGERQLEAMLRAWFRPGIGNARRALGTLAGEQLGWFAQSARTLRAALRDEAVNAQLPGTDVGTTLPPRRNAGVSWQATLTNLLLRLTVKQVMAWASLERASELQRIGKRLDRVPDGVRSEAVKTDTFRGEWIGPRTATCRRAVLHLPGGAFIFPATPGHRSLLSRVCGSADARGLLVHYRLAPQHPFPAGLEDAIAAYRFLLAEGFAPRDIAVIGDSAGGGLALALLFALREQRIELPGALVLLSALADLSLSRASRRYNRWRDTLLPVRDMQEFRLYRGEHPVDHPLLSPVHGDFHGFPPVFAQVSGTETLLDDTLAVARKARAQGVDFEVEVWDGMPHDWHIFAMIPEARQALDRVGQFLRAHLGRAAPAARARRR